MNLFLNPLLNFRDSDQPPGSRRDMIKLSTNDVFFNCFPYFHIGGMFLSLFWPLAVGSKIIVTPRFDQGTFFETVSKYKVKKSSTYYRRIWQIRPLTDKPLRKKPQIFLPGKTQKTRKKLFFKQL